MRTFSFSLVLPPPIFGSLLYTCSQQHTVAPSSIPAHNSTPWLPLLKYPVLAAVAVDQRPPRRASGTMIYGRQVLKQDPCDRLFRFDSLHCLPAFDMSHPAFCSFGSSFTLTYITCTEFAHPPCPLFSPLPLLCPSTAHMYRRRVKKPPAPVFGSTLEEMGFSINERSQIVDQSGNPYKFDLKAKDRLYQEAHSRALGEVTTAVVLKKLQEELGLIPTKVPFGMDKDDETSPHATILVSPDAKQCKRLLVLISGTLETLGIWSRRLMTNSSVDDGSMYSTVKQALKEGYGVVVLNPNAHWWVDGRATVQVPTGRVFKTVPDLESPEIHVDYVLRNLVQAAASKEIFFIAQKYGAQALIQALHTQFDAFKDRVSAVVTIESSHSIDAFSGSAFRNWWKLNAINYIQSEVEDKNKVGYRETIGCNCVNAGTHEYDYTIIEMMPSVFRFFSARKDRDNEFEKNKDVILPPNEDDPTTVVITFDEAAEEEAPSTATEDDSGWHDTTPVNI